MRRIKHLLTSYGSTGVAQGLTFFALLLPVVTADALKIAVSMLPLAIGTIVSRICTFGFHATYLRNAADQRTSIFVNAAWATALLPPAIYFLGSALDFLSGDLSALVQMCALAILGQSIYLVGITMLIAGGSLGTYGRVRLLYGTVSLLSTGVAVFFIADNRALLWAAAFSTAFAGLVAVAISSKQLQWCATKSETFKFKPRTARQSLTAALGSAVGDAGGQAGAFALPFMGEYAPLWASMFRVSGGMSTVAQQILAPPLEIKFVSAVGSGDRAATLRLALRAISFGATLALITVAVQWLIFFSVDDPAYSSQGALPMLLIAAFSLASVGIGCVLRFPLLLHRDREFATLQLTRVAAFIIIGILLTDIKLIALLVATQLAFSLFFIKLSLPRTSGTSAGKSSG